MTAIPKKAETRIKTGLKQYQKVLKSAKSRDVNEADTVTIVRDMLGDIFGYDKYTEITGEFAIRSTFCDLAITMGNKINFLIEVKAIGLDLKENHLRQAVNYAANQGISWILLTNGIQWQMWRVLFQKPIKEEKVFQIDLLEVSSRDSQVIETLYLLSREGLGKAAIEDYQNKMQAINRFTIAALLQSESMLNSLRREIRRLNKGVKIDIETLHTILKNEVLKRDVVDGDKAQEAMTKVKKQRTRAKKRTSDAHATKMPPEKSEAPALTSNPSDPIEN